MKISVSMIALNEGKNMARALSSCSFADEIVVVDGGSTDSTLDILRAHDKVVLIQHQWENHFGKQRQVSLEHCTGEWVIRLDADEAFSKEFEANIRNLLSSTSPEVIGYNIRQCNLIGNENYYSKIIDNYETNPRIWRNLPALKWERQIHEILGGLYGKIGQWDVYVVHYGFLDKKRYRQKGKYYSDIPESGFKDANELYYREYNIQPKPRRAAVASHVPEYKTEESFAGKPEIAIVRGPNLNQWEAQNYEPLSDKFNITLYSNDSPCFDLTHIKLPVVKLPSHSEDRAYMKGLEFELFDKDIIYTADITWMFTSQAVIAKHKFGKKVIALEWENIPFAHEENEIIREIKQLNRNLVDVFVAVTKRAKDALLLEGVPEDKIVVIPMGIDTGRFRPDKETGKKIRKDLGITEEEKVVLFTGRMVWEKGIYDLVHAAKLVTLDKSIKTLPLRFMVVGRGPEAQEIKKIVNRLCMNNIFLFIESHPYHQMHEIYNMADIFVLPSIATRTWKEQFGMVLAEAMACGVPVISTVSGSIDEVVADAGLLVQPNDPTELSAAIIKLLKDDALRNALRIKGRERAVREYDSKKIAGMFASLFEDVLRSTFKGAVSELAEYTQLKDNDILKRIRSVYSQQIQEWKGVIGQQLTQDKVLEFYRRTDSYLFDLVQYNYENHYYVQWTEDLFNFCAGLKNERRELKILDFGGGIGSQMISLSRLKGAKLCYADIPGKTSEYAKWRFNRRHVDIEMIDASKEDFLEGRMYDVVITLDVVEHLVDPEAVVRYLVNHIKPDGYLAVVTSFVDNNGEAGWHLNADRYTDEAFYDFIKSLGMELLNNEYPRIFQKNNELVTLLEEIASAIGEGRYADSKIHIESYLQLRPFDLDMLVKYAEVCLRLGERDVALENIEKVLLLNPDMPEALGIAERIKSTDNENTSCK
jgi:glycosyltransferase involved in cell wall biosynthesis/2-polyprenyl-3-methyl-5-hydroxy-6-metoxy-1,4-benzoquinol methylase